MDDLDNLVIKAKLRHRKRYESMIFNNQTTALTDYRCGRILGSKVTKYKEKGRSPTPRKVSLRNTETLTDWKEGNVRFDLFLKPKEIVNTDPRKIQKYQEEPEDTGRAEAQRTRPRLVMTPAVSMDDIEDPKAREILCVDLYTTTAAAAMREAVRPCYRVEAPLSGKNGKANPLVLPKYKPPVVPGEWRMDSAKWDNRQHRCSCDPTQEFWLKFPQPNCRSCVESAIMKNERDAKRLAQRRH